MHFWHSDGNKPASTGCGTAHCIAGWVVTLTPGGIELSMHVEKLFSSGRSGSDELPFAILDAAEGSAQAAAALAIIYESGWQEHVTVDHFFSPDGRDAIILLTELARLEEQREKGVVSTVDRQATTLIP
jgi:hypothetical protein